MRIRHNIALFTLLPVLLLGIGCKTVVRENIISSIETGLGVTVAENPKTESYEAKVGFIRSQFYSVPTGKVVEQSGETTVKSDGKSKSKEEKKGTDKLSNRANVTPELVSGIRVHSGAEHLFIGADISESFAVGKIAVTSGAATAMYIANAKNDRTARAAAKAVDPAAKTSAAKIIADQNKEADEVVKAIYSQAGKPDEPDAGKLKKAIKGTVLEEKYDQLIKMKKDDFDKKLRSRWRDVIGELHDNLNP